MLEKQRREQEELIKTEEKKEVDVMELQLLTFVL